MGQNSWPDPCPSFTDERLTNFKPVQEHNFGTGRDKVLSSQVLYNGLSLVVCDRLFPMAVEQRNHLS